MFLQGQSYTGVVLTAGKVFVWLFSILRVLLAVFVPPNFHRIQPNFLFPTHPNMNVHFFTYLLELLFYSVLNAQFC
jgi:hypothetical protein